MKHDEKWGWKLVRAGIGLGERSVLNPSIVNSALPT